MNPNDELNGLGYISSAPDLVQRDEPKAIDEAEISTMERALKLLANRREYYLSIDSLALKDENFTMEQQLANNKRQLLLIQELENMLLSVVNQVKDKLNGRQY